MLDVVDRRRRASFLGVLGVEISDKEIKGVLGETGNWKVFRSLSAKEVGKASEFVTSVVVAE